MKPDLLDFIEELRAWTIVLLLAGIVYALITFLDIDGEVTVIEVDDKQCVITRSSPFFGDTICWFTPTETNGVRRPALE